MLTSCPECKESVSTSACTCPHCGYVLAPSGGADFVSPRTGRRPPIFLVLAVLSFVVTLFTPRLLVFFPVLTTLAFCVVSLFRRERFRLLPWLILGSTVLLLFSNTSSLDSGATRQNLSAVEIVSWHWTPDPGFGVDGAVKWTVQLRNQSNRYIDNVEVELTTYDAAGNLITTHSTYVSAIPPGGTRSDESYADYYGTESNARIQVTGVNFAR